MKAKKNKKHIKNFELKKLIKLIKFASSKGFSGVEFPYFRFFQDIDSTPYLKNYLKDFNQNYVLDCEKKISKKELLKLIKISNKIDVNFIRLKCTSILSCERYKYKKKWNIKLNLIIKKINQIKEFLNKYKIKLAIENHQDLDSNDLKYIISKVGKEYVGINFDVGNAFATCEYPVDFFNKIKNHILNIHLKDYIILYNNKGYSLNRCPILDGNSNILKILNLTKKYKLNVPISLELGAEKPRIIKIKSKKFFENFLKEKKIKLKNSNSIMKLGINNFKNLDKIKKLISLNEINMLNKSIYNLNQKI